MATFIIPKGKHYHAWPPVSTLPWFGSQTMVRYVTFDVSCAYASDAYHALDVNKLFGLSFGFGGVHYNSARFGWRYNTKLECIELLAYCYINGSRNNDSQLNFPVVARVALGQKVRCSILVSNDQSKGPVYAFCVAGIGTVTIARPDEVAPFGLTHGLYFGGALAAPHEMKVQIDRS